MSDSTKHFDGNAGWRGSESLWLDAAYDLFIKHGLDAVKVMTLAERLGLSRTSFYWHFKSREALITALIDRWRKKNTDNLVAASERSAQTITENVLFLFDCWLNPDLFDADFDYAVRGLSASHAGLRNDIANADTVRLAAIQTMFEHHNYPPLEADIRAHTLYLTQVGYIMARFNEPLETRLARIPLYVQSFTGWLPTKNEINAFVKRNQIKTP